MVKFSEKTIGLTKHAIEYVKKHENDMPSRTITVLLTKDDDFLSSAVRAGSDFAWYTDEARERGGQGKGASPLSYFLSAMGFCQFVHYTEHAIVDNIAIDSLTMKIDGTISMQRPRRFIEVIYEVQITSPQSDEQIRKLAKAAAEDCYVTNTLRRSCKVTGFVVHNGNRLDTHADQDTI